jgi:hypothetical protein
MVETIGDIRIPARIDGDTVRLVEAGLRSRTVRKGGKGAVEAARQRAHHCGARPNKQTKNKHTTVTTKKLVRDRNSHANTQKHGLNGRAVGSISMRMLNPLRIKAYHNLATPALWSTRR